MSTVFIKVIKKILGLGVLLGIFGSLVLVLPHKSIADTSLLSPASSGANVSTTGTVDMLYEAHSYTPPFYKGKALYPYQGTVTVVANPTFGAKSDKYTYEWYVNDTLSQNSSGNSINLAGNILLTALDVSVTVTDTTTSISGTGKISFGGQNPTAVLYEDNPLYGLLLNKAIPSSFSLTNTEIDLKALGYDFNTSAPFVPDASFVWSINGSPVAAQNTSGDTITLRAPAGASGSSVVSVVVTSPDFSFQRSTPTNSTISFDQHK